MNWLRKAGCCLAALAAPPLAAQELAIDTARSSITIHVEKAGLLSAAAHDHWVSARIAAGTIDEAGGWVAFKVLSAALVVRPDPKVDAKTRDQIQQDMQKMTLESGRFPEIAFRSTHVGAAGAGQFKVDGALTLHGVTKGVNVVVKHAGEAWTGHTAIRQTDFGIKPISIGGGIIRIRDAVDIDFEIFARI